MKRYPKEVKDFIATHVKGMRTRELAEMVNARFGTEFTASSMKSYKQNYKLRSGLPRSLPAGRPTAIYPAEVREFILNNYIGTGPKTMTDLLNKKFGSDYTRNQIQGYYKNHKLNSGLSGRFIKGYLSGKPIPKGVRISPATEFQKGHMPHNHKPVGTESLRSDGYVWVKIAEPKTWREKHVLIWEAVNGPRPAGHVIIFADGNRLNFDPDNLVLTSWAQLARLNQNHLIKNDPELTKSGIIVASILNKIGERRKGAKTDGKKRIHR